jgi:hypothetical protein
MNGKLRARRWRDLTGRQKAAATASAAVQCGLAAAAWADLARRPPAGVRGPKWRWAALIAVNYAGPIAYFRWVRTRPAQAAPVTGPPEQARGGGGKGDKGDKAEACAGAAVMLAGLLTPFRRGRRSQWGVGAQSAARRYPGDELIPQPLWGWTHGIEISAPAPDVWPWVAQIGADRGGFYSYQWLENLIGCQVHNAETIHPEWAAQPGGQLRLHPDAPALRIVSVEPGRSVVAYMPPAPGMRGAEAVSGAPGRPIEPNGRWMTASWLFLVEPTGPDRCRVISRYRCATSGDLVSRLEFGPAIIEPISFAMDRRMLLGLKQRAERGKADQ